MRLLAAHGLAAMSEVPLPNGRRADVMAISEKGQIWIVEIKSGIEDYRSDQKWGDYLEFCDRFYFAVDGDFPNELIPDTTGLIIADRYSAELIRDGTAATLPAARRRSLTLRFARLAAARLHTLWDPDGNTGNGWGY